ncbi:MAG: hypothetical protein ACRCV9_15570 [Burkholderiaceae bacterium]
MKLEVLIQPRTDGTLELLDAEGKTHKFKREPNAKKFIVDIENDEVAEAAIATGNFKAAEIQTAAAPKADKPVKPDAAPKADKPV